MSESSPTSTELLAMSGTENAALGTKRPTKNSGLDFFNEIVDEYDRFEKAFGLAGGGRVYKDGTLTYGVRPIKFHDGNFITYVGASAQTLTSSTTNYIYLTASGTSGKLTKNTTGFPAFSTTPHLRLAQIVTTSTYDETTAITDQRADGFASVQSMMTGANANTLTKGATSDATALHRHTTLSGTTLNATTSIKYASVDIKTRLPRLKLSAAAIASDVINTRIIVTDYLSAANPGRYLVRAWVGSGTTYGTAVTAPNSAITCSNGVIVRTIETRKSWEIATSANGTASLGIKHVSTSTFQLNAEIDGFITTAALVYT